MWKWVPLALHLATCGAKYPLLHLQRCCLLLHLIILQMIMLIHVLYPMNLILRILKDPYQTHSHQQTLLICNC
jgi:hypothetical protein